MAERATSGRLLALALLTACGSTASGGLGDASAGPLDGARDQLPAAASNDAGDGAALAQMVGTSGDGSPPALADAQSFDADTPIQAADATSAVHRDAGATGANEGPLPGTNAMVFPAPGAQGVCPDPPLRITFASAPTLGNAGAIRVHDESGAVVATIDMSAATYSDTIGGVTFNLLRPVFVDGNDVAIYLKSHALAYGKTYSVTIDAGAILGPGGMSVVVSDATSWRFSTAAGAPADLAAIAVALNGSGEFCSVQGALDAIAGRSAASTITVNVGRYHEVIHAAAAKSVTLEGADREGTIIDATNNENLNPTTTTRSIVGFDDSTNLVIDNLTIQNSTPQGGSQAEALRLQNCDECVVRNANIVSTQDTLLWSGRIYAESCYVAGNVDFVWGTGAAYFKSCEIHTVGRAGAIVQARNGSSGYGYVFVDSKLTADSTVSGQVLGRIDVGMYPASHVAYINCTMGPFIAPAGWTITGGSDTSQLRFWEYQSVDAAGRAVDTSQRVAGSKQITQAVATSMRDPSVVLSGWSP